MTSQFDFTNNEWNDIAALPVLVGYAVAKAEHSGVVGNFLEERALMAKIAEEAPDTAERGLIDAASIVDVKDKIDEFGEYAPDLLADVAATACAQIAGVLDDKAEPSEATAYKTWVLEVGNRVANAAKESGVRVSAPEATLLDRLKTALGL